MGDVHHACPQFVGIGMSSQVRMVVLQHAQDIFTYVPRNLAIGRHGCCKSGRACLRSVASTVVVTIAYVVLQWPLCISLLEDRKINIMPIISHRFGFDEAEVAKGFDTALRSAETKAVKVMFNM